MLGSQQHSRTSLNSGGMRKRPDAKWEACACSNGRTVHGRLLGVALPVPLVDLKTLEAGLGAPAARKQDAIIEVVMISEGFGQQAQLTIRC